jgi:CRISPR-associated protein Csd2
MSTKKKNVDGLLKQRGFGIVVVEANMSTPNGDPDSGNLPRMTPEGFGVITDVCLKHRIREIISDHNNPCWEVIRDTYGLDDNSFYIFETKDRGFDSENEKEAIKTLKKFVKDHGTDGFFNRFWDARVFGATVLEDSKDRKDKNVAEMPRITKTGCVQVTPLKSVAPINVIELNIAKANPLDFKNAEKGTGTFGSKSVVEHALYTGALTINPFVAYKTGTTEKDIKLFKKLISHAFSTSTAASRADVKVRNVFYIEHSDVLGNSKLETKLANATKPVVKEGVENPTSIDDYVFPTLVDIQKIMGKTKVVDLCD